MPNIGRKKLDPRAKAYILVGYGSNQYKLLDPITRKTIWVRDAYIVEGRYLSDHDNQLDDQLADQLTTDQLTTDQLATDQLATDQLATDQLADQMANDQLAEPTANNDQPAEPIGNTNTYNDFIS